MDLEFFLEFVHALEIVKRRRNRPVGGAKPFRYEGFNKLFLSNLTLQGGFIVEEAGNRNALAIEEQGRLAIFAIGFYGFLEFPFCTGDSVSTNWADKFFFRQ